MREEGIFFIQWHDDPRKIQTQTDRYLNTCKHEYIICYVISLCSKNKKTLPTHNKETNGDAGNEGLCRAYAEERNTERANIYLLSKDSTRQPIEWSMANHHTYAVPSLHCRLPTRDIFIHQLHRLERWKIDRGEITLGKTRIYKIRNRGMYEIAHQRTL